MAFSTLFDFNVLVLLKTARAQCDCVLKLHACTDLRRLTDDYASTVIDEKISANFRAWVNIDSGAAMCPFGHDPWNQRHFVIKEMRHSINRDGFQCGISENDLFVTPRSRITFVGCIDIRPK